MSLAGGWGEKIGAGGGVGAGAGAGEARVHASWEWLLAFSLDKVKEFLSCQNVPEFSKNLEKMVNLSFPCRF